MSTWRLERDDGGENWVTLMASPHRLNLEDLHGPSAITSPIRSGDLYASLPIPGNKTVFAGVPGTKARIRYNDQLVELYEWAEIPINEFNLDEGNIWGWKLTVQHKAAVPFEELWPLQM